MDTGVVGYDFENDNLPNYKNFDKIQNVTTNPVSITNLTMKLIFKFQLSW